MMLPVKMILKKNGFVISSKFNKSVNLLVEAKKTVEANELLTLPLMPSKEPRIVSRKTISKLQSY